MFASNSSQNVRYLAITSGILALVYLTVGTDFRFFDLLSVVIVLGGTALAGLVSYSFDELNTAVKDSIHSRKIDPREFSERINYFAELALIKRTKGDFSLENYARSEYDPMIKKGLQLIADGVRVEELRQALNLDYRLLLEKRRSSIKILNQLAAIAPASGLIGTVIGLVQMLGQINNSAELSHGLSVALLTTLYGAVLSYLILQPLANKLEDHIEGEDMLLDLTVEGLVSIGAGYAPQLLKERLESYAA